MYEKSTGGVVELNKNTVKSSRVTGSKKRKRGALSSRKGRTVAQVEATITKNASTATAPSADHAVRKQKEQQLRMEQPQQRHKRFKNTDLEAMEMEKPIELCMICRQEKPNGLVDLRTNTVMKKTLSSYCSVPLPENALAAVCVQCVCTFNIHHEVKQKLAVRLQRLTSGQIISAVQNNAMEKRRNQDLALENLPNTPDASPSTCYEAEALASAILSSPEPVRTEDANDSLRLPTPPLTADLSAPNTPEDKNKSASSSLITLDAGLTPPPYSPHQLSHSDNENYGIIQPETAAKRDRYVVKVEEITPVKSKSDSSSGGKNDADQTDGVAPLQMETFEDDASPQLISQDKISSAPNSPGLNHSMLEVFCVRAECARATESGGRINNYDRGRRASQIQYPLVCPHCAKTYIRTYYFQKHVKTCRKIRRPAITKGGGDVEDGADDVSAPPLKALSEGGGRRMTTFCCKQCGAIVGNRNELRSHQRAHMEHFSCECGREFTTQYQKELHRVVCQAQQEAQAELIAATKRNRRTGIKAVSTTAIPNRRMTRSRSLAVSRHSLMTVAPSSYAPTTVAPSAYAPTIVPDEVDLNDRNNNLKNEMISTAKDEFEDDDSEDGVNSEDGADSEDGVDSEDEVDSDEAPNNSTVDCLLDWMGCKSPVEPTVPPRITDGYKYDSTETGKINVNGARLNDESYEEILISTYKELDLHNLDCLKEQIRKQSFHCYEADCKEPRPKTMVELMVHDYTRHYKSWFHCRKCDRVFTRKVFLDYHLERQNSAFYCCKKCLEGFEYQHELDRHHILHSKEVNYRCSYCDLEFLSQHLLEEHCDFENHDANDDRKKVSIERSLTIANTVSSRAVTAVPQQQEPSVEPNATLLEMKLPHVPSKKPIDLPGSCKIGAIRFKNEACPNCRGCQ